MGRVPEDNQIDPESEDLIARVNSYFGDDNMKLMVAFVIIREFTQWVSKQTRSGLRRKLVHKMTKGAIEHGPSDKKQAQKELEEEYLDLFGWTLKRDL